MEHSPATMPAVHNGARRRASGVPFKGILRPIMRAWLNMVRPALQLVPAPRDDPRGHAGGPDPIRVFMLGNCPLIGLGVSSNELALPGQVARHLAAATGRGVEVVAQGSRSMSADNATEMLDDRPLRSFHAIVITLGFLESLTLMRVKEWEGGLEHLIARLDEMAPDVPILLVGAHELRVITLFDSIFGSVATAHLRVLNQIGAEVAARHNRVRWSELEPRVTGIDARYLRPEDYSVWGADIATTLATVIDDPASAPLAEPRTLPERDLDDERRCNAAVEAVRGLPKGESAELDRVVGLAQRMFHTAGAAITLVGDDRQWVFTGAGAYHAADDIERDLSICSRTIEQDDVMVVADVSLDERFDKTALSDVVRFYAGYPLVSPDGQRIGALCVFDPEPRVGQTIDPSMLREIGKFAQRTLWDLATDHRKR